MDELEDDEVVFSNTALYEHLVSSGFSDFESASCLQQTVIQSTEVSVQTQQKVAGVREQLTAVADWLGVRPGPRLVPAALSALLDSGLMADRDRAMAADLCSDQSRQPGTATTTDSFLLSVFLAVLAVAVWLPAWWLPLAAALLLCVGGAAVARLRVADGQRRVDEFCRAAGELKRAGLRCCRLLQESHLMARGVTLSSGDAGAEAAFAAQYGDLVQAAGACLHAACAAYGRATRRLRLQQPLLDGVDPDRHYIACDQSALAGFDETSFTVKDVKSLHQLLAESQSEFVRRCCLGLSGELLPPDADRTPPVPLTLLDELTACLTELQRRLSAAYRAHAALWAAEPEPAPSAARPTVGPQRLYVGVHSVCLQAQVVALRARALEEALSEAQDDDEQSAEPRAKLYARLRRELTEIQRRLDSGQLFCEQTLLQLSRLEVGDSDQPAPAHAPPTVPAPTAAPVPLLSDLPEPELVDQFFEAVVEGGPREGADSEDVLLSREERLRRRLERDRARELLSELNVALTGKRQEWRVREALAKGEPVPPPPPPPATGQPSATAPQGDPYKVDPTDLYDFSGSEEEGDAVEPWQRPGKVGRRAPPPDVPDVYRVDRRDLYRFSDSDGEAEPGTALVLPPAGDLTHLLPVQRRARPPSRRPPSRPGSMASTPRGEPGAPADQTGDSAGSEGFSPLRADSDASVSDPSGAGSPAASAEVAAAPPPAGSARYRAAALGLPPRQGFPADMAAQAAALALRRRQQRPDEETFGDPDSDGDD
ncbi:uncharacterized protein LOC122365458 [Amphibalanus amphitrite]|uniref:uncharacterized protein LOC122365458 n=1 Tax=Amphibalanus amphitrite TaxID=1232801 RepID=UPI001C9052A5|nr:uncharacterized protein LOC122365458 [Amphibalanus amphitrite]